MQSALNIGVFPMGVLVILLIKNHGSTTSSNTQKLYNALAILAMFSIAADLLVDCLGGISITLNWALNVMAFLSYSALPGLWLVYSYVCVYGNDSLKNDWLGILILALPVIASIVITLVTPFTNLVFTINDNNTFVRRDGLFSVVLLSAIEIGFSITISAFEAFRASSLERRRECLLFAILSLLPLADIIVWIITDAEWMLWPLYSIELAFLYINVQNKMITSDSLTGLNNRVEFDKYLDMLINHHDGYRDFYLFILDVDDFKSINDKYGHNAGDEALRRMADILRETFGFMNAFFSRLGGDEFAMIIDKRLDSASIVSMINDAIIESDERVESEYKLSVSIGHSACEKGTHKTAKQIFEEADKEMYANKKLRKGEAS